MQLKRGSELQPLLLCGPAGSEAVEIQVGFTLSRCFPAAVEIQLWLVVQSTHPGWKQEPSTHLPCPPPLLLEELSLEEK